jgi:hypothetical protein|tara:strand:- start:14 stop:178 length:165 start_codon:yes stop_codon:yes gene_type:complete
MNTGNENEVSKTDIKTEINVKLIRFEEFALSLEEHFHASSLYAQNPNSKPLGHR